MNHEGEELENRAARLADLYFRKHDYHQMAEYLADDVTWIGISKDRICLTKDEVLKVMEMEMKVTDGIYEILQEWHYGIEVSERVGVTLAILKVRTPKKELYMTEIDTRISIVWRRQDGDWKAVHIHQSTPDDRLAGLAAFNAEVARNTYNKINDVIKKEARTDSMTRINNMEGFVEQAQHIFKSYPDQKFAVIKFGIRDFRFINRTYGFSTGDRLLKTIARNLEEACGRREACGRIEKDTFSILLVYEGENSMRRRMEEIRRELTKDGWIKEIELEVWLNAGIYIPTDTRSETVKGMLDKALMAMQSIRKYVKEDRYAYYSDWMLQQHYNNSQILEWASSAIEKKEFKLYIQPQFDMKTENIVGGEALCRWQLSNGLVIMPNEFVPLFEDYNLIYRFDLYMLELVCSYMNKWMKEGKQLKPVSVNQSRADIEQDSFFEDFCSIVDRYEIPHEYLTFELTESAFIEEGNRIMKLARELHRKGFKLAIDDFGTGYASLNMLSVVSGDILKIDKSLLESDNRRTRVIFEKVIEMAHSMDMMVVCEGVETQEQRKLLCMLNCDIGQGFLAGKAMKAEDYGKRYIKRRL